MSGRSAKVIAELCHGVQPPDPQWTLRARAHLDTLTKPLGSLGRLEDLATQLVTLNGGPLQLPLSKAVYVFAADHGITAEGVSAYPKAVTHQMVLNFLHGGAAINVLARLHNVDLHVVDMGMDADFADSPGLLHHKIARGTANMLREPAMTDEQLACALATGAALAGEAAGRGVQLLAIGEMGIGNTTSASVITCGLTQARPTEATGRGTGLDAAAHDRKVGIVEEILARHCPAVRAPGPLDLLRNVGGFEIAAMTGMVLGAARHQVAVVADGFISTAAAALAVALAPGARACLVAGHRSQEPGHRILLEWLGLEPVLALEMRLGEGSGAVLAIPVIESAAALYAQMATFSSAGVSGAGA